MPAILPAGVTGGPAERTVLAEDALAEAALATDPAGDATLAFEAIATPTSTPAAPVLSEDEMVEELIPLLDTEDPPGAFVDFMLRHVTDGPSFIAFLRASQRAYLDRTLAGCAFDPEVAAAGAKGLAESFRPFFLALAARAIGVLPPGAPMYVLLASNPALATNANALVLGFLEGMASSKLATADALFDIVADNALLTAVLPLHAACFIAGTIYQILKDLHDTVMTLIAAIGYADELIPLACRIIAALPAALGRLLDAESAGDLAELGAQAGMLLADSLHAYIPTFTASTPFAEMAQELARFSFDQGTFFGPLLVDLILSFVGVGFVAGAVKLAAKIAQIAPDVLVWLIAFLRRLFDAIDPGLFDDLAKLGARITSALSSRLDALADQAEALYGIAADTLREAFDLLEDTLGTERFREYAGTMFCKLDGG